MTKETYQCTTCGEVFSDPAELDEQDDCESCVDKYHDQQARYWRGLWEGENYPARADWDEVLRTSEPEEKHGDAACGGDLA